MRALTPRPRPALMARRRYRAARSRSLAMMRGLLLPDLALWLSPLASPAGGGA